MENKFPDTYSTIFLPYVFVICQLKTMQMASLAFSRKFEKLDKPNIDKNTSTYQHQKLLLSNFRPSCFLYIPFTRKSNIHLTYNK